MTDMKEIGILEQSITINNFYTHTLLVFGSASSGTFTSLHRSFTRQPDFQLTEIVV